MMHLVMIRLVGVIITMPLLVRLGVAGDIKRIHQRSKCCAEWAAPRSTSSAMRSACWVLELPTMHSPLASSLRAVGFYRPNVY
jgi:hypothetical protein